jgi:hypothetical protein
MRLRGVEVWRARGARKSGTPGTPGKVREVGEVMEIMEVGEVGEVGTVGGVVRVHKKCILISTAMLGPEPRCRRLSKANFPAGIVSGTKKRTGAETYRHRRGVQLHVRKMGLRVFDRAHGLDGSEYLDK